jgi:hypothetical protein
MPQEMAGPPLIFVNKVLLEHSHVHLFGHLCAELGFDTEQSLKELLSASLQKKF